ncbi:hypothetical protein [Lysobacter terrae]
MAVYPYELGELLDSTEFAPEAESAEWQEARRSNVRTARRGNATPQTPAQGYATKAELTATANRLDERIAVNSNAIKTVEGRFNGVAADHAKLKADVGRLQGGLNDLRNMSMLMPLLTTQTSRELQSTAGGTLQRGDRVVIDTGDMFSRMMPMFLFSGSFGGSGTQSGQSGGMFGGDSSGIMLIAMMMAMQGKK